METLLLFLALPWVWAVLACCGCLIWCMETESPFLATFCAIGTGCALQWWAGIPLLESIQANPFVIVPWFFGYIGVGVVWSIAKWYMFCLEQRRQYLKDQKTGKKTYSGQVDTEADVRPKAANYRADIYMWIAYWPVSMIWTLIDDPVRRMINAVIDWLKDLYQKISDSVWADVKIDEDEKK